MTAQSTHDRCKRPLTVGGSMKTLRRASLAVLLFALEPGEVSAQICQATHPPCGHGSRCSNPDGSWGPWTYTYTPGALCFGETPCGLESRCVDGNLGCPAQQPKPAGTVCPPQPRACDVAEVCDGVSTSGCPAH